MNKRVLVIFSSISILIVIGCLFIYDFDITDEVDTYTIKETSIGPWTFGGGQLDIRYPAFTTKDDLVSLTYDDITYESEDSLDYTQIFLSIYLGTIDQNGKSQRQLLSLTSTGQELSDQICRGFVLPRLSTEKQSVSLSSEDTLDCLYLGVSVNDDDNYSHHTYKVNLVKDQ